MQVRDVKETQILQAAEMIQEQFVTGDALKRSIRDDILRLVDMRARRGTRHALGLPVSNARTSSNGHTAKKLRHLIMLDTSRK